MRKKRNRLQVLKISAWAITLAFTIPLSVKGLILVEPMITASAQKIAFVSAGMGILEGGFDFLKSEGIDITPVNHVEKDEDIPNTFEGMGNIEDLYLEDPSLENITIPENSGPIKKKQFSVTNPASYINISGNAYVKNATKVTSDKIKGAIKSKLDFKVKASKDPQVLIMHTHATESYEAEDIGYYDKSNNSRTTDNTKNMVSIGDRIAKELENAGIGVIHNATLHDYPAYTGSYDRSAVTVKNILKKYPSIKVVLDVHRDSIQQDDGIRIAPVAEINGKSAAQVMIISGCDDGTMNYPDYLKNLSFATKVQNTLESEYKGLTRPLLFAYKKYNQNLTTGSILLEMGSDANTLEQAQYTGELVGKGLAKALLDS